MHLMYIYISIFIFNVCQLEDISLLATLLRVLARMSEWRKQDIKCLIILRSGEGVTSITEDNSSYLF